MTYNIRYLAIYIGGLKFCNVRYILSYKFQNIKLYTRNELSIDFYYRVSIECSIMVKKSADGIKC